MKEMAFEKRRIEERAAQKKLKKLAAKTQDENMNDEDMEVGPDIALAAAANNAQTNQTQAQYPEDDAIVDGDLDRSRRAFLRIFKQVVDLADVVVQVLDARDPMACRSPEVERSVAEAGPSKQLVLLLNKVDLIPKEAAQKWLAYFRTQHPTIAFSATHSPPGNHGSSRRAGSSA